MTLNGSRAISAVAEVLVFTCYSHPNSEIKARYPSVPKAFLVWLVGSLSSWVAFRDELVYNPGDNSADHISRVVVLIFDYSSTSSLRRWSPSLVWWLLDLSSTDAK